MGTANESVEKLVDQVTASRLPSPRRRKKIRTDAGVSIRAAAAAIPVAPMTLLRWENDTAKPQLGHAIAYRELLDALQAAVDGTS